MRAERSDRIAVYGLPVEREPASAASGVGNLRAPGRAAAPLPSRHRRRTRRRGHPDVAPRDGRRAGARGRADRDRCGRHRPGALPASTRSSIRAGRSSWSRTTPGSSGPGRAPGPCGARGSEIEPEVVVPFEPSLPAITDRGWPEARLPKSLSQTRRDARGSESSPIPVPSRPPPERTPMPPRAFGRRARTTPPPAPAAASGRNAAPAPRGAPAAAPAARPAAVETPLTVRRPPPKAPDSGAVIAEVVANIHPVHRQVPRHVEDRGLDNQALATQLLASSTPTEAGVPELSPPRPAARRHRARARHQGARADSSPCCTIRGLRHPHQRPRVGLRGTARATRADRHPLPRRTAPPAHRPAIAGWMGRRVDESSPMLDARLPDGSRVNVIIPPSPSTEPRSPSDAS